MRRGWTRGPAPASLTLSPYWYSGRSLGEHLELYDEDREDLKAWSIEACDVSEDERKEINKKKERRRGERRRRKEGVDTREQYLAKNTKSSKKPWKALKMSRAKYYRLGLHRRETGPSAPTLILNIPDGPVSHRACRKAGRTVHGMWFTGGHGQPSGATWGEEIVGRGGPLSDGASPAAAIVEGGKYPRPHPNANTASRRRRR